MARERSDIMDGGRPTGEGQVTSPFARELRRETEQFFGAEGGGTGAPGSVSGGGGGMGGGTKGDRSLQLPRYYAGGYRHVDCSK